mmetsp:Transcript_17827/g.30234  ORF Transcript_17827/g.30234 Transcript_17827/m.30234 type:complete len:159 (-) Transcript_17827:63-539(-)
MLDYETSSEMLVDKDKLREMEEQGEHEMEEGDLEGEEGEEEEDQFQFAEEKERSSKVHAEGTEKDLEGEQSDRSQDSKKIIEFDEEGNFLNMKEDTESQKSEADSISMEMTDLSSAKAPLDSSKVYELVSEYKPPAAKTQSQKKREKRKAKKQGGSTA